MNGSLAAVFPVDKEGSMWLDVYDLNIYVNSTIMVNTAGFIIITGMEISAEWSEIKMHLDNIIGEILEHLIELWVVSIWDQVHLIIEYFHLKTF